MKQISITINEIVLKATLLDTPTADAIYNALPIDGQAQIWGDEIYFGIPVSMKEEAEAREEVEVGDLAFWPIGSAFCIFYGRTPVSNSEKPRAYSPVNVFGKIEGSVEVLKKVAPQSLVQVRKI
ncbi:cyclophilin-like fold protein [Draconibacterium sp.]|nr:cyclophilin-like fold protein [Draconibacterium sp.]